MRLGPGSAMWRSAKPYLYAQRRSPTGGPLGIRPMIYILAVFLPPLALLLNGQIFAAVFNFVMIVPCLLLGFAFPALWLVPAAHAVIAIYMAREDRKHREIVDAIERHGPPPGWRG